MTIKDTFPEAKYLSVLKCFLLGTTLLSGWHNVWIFKWIKIKSSSKQEKSKKEEEDIGHYEFPLVCSPFLSASFFFFPSPSSLCSFSVWRVLIWVGKAAVAAWEPEPFASSLGYCFQCTMPRVILGISSGCPGVNLNRTTISAGRERRRWVRRRQI